MAYVVAFAALLGACLGSFANVVIHRVPAGESIVSPPSACPSCGERIKFRHNIPVVSWLWLRGRCSTCGARISSRYLFVEVLCAVAFAAVVTWQGVSWEAALLLVLVFFTVVLSAIDFETLRLPNVILLPFGALSLAIVIVAALTRDESLWATRALLGALGLGAVYFGAFMAYPRGLGLGDVKLAPILGLILGFFGWGPLVVGGFAAFLWGAVVGIAFGARRGSGLKARIPFGPWMFAGAWTGVLVGDPAWDWYLGVAGAS